MRFFFTFIPPTEFAEDAAHTSGDKGVQSLLVQKATPADIASEGDYTPAQVSAGRVWTSSKIDTALPAGTNAIGKLAANDGVDIGDVTINNASGASAVNIQDGGNSITVDGSVTANAGTNLNTSALALDATLGTTNTEIGATNETAPASDTATSGLNGRLQRIAQRITSLITALGSPFQAGGSIGNTSFIATQATGTNLHTVVDSGAITATLSAETTKVIGTVNQGTNPWVTSNATTSVVGNGAAATAQRVTLANDSTGVIATVGAVTAITNALPTGTNSLGDIRSITTSIVPGTAATNLGKAEDSVHASGDTGVMALGVSNVAQSTLNADGDYSVMATDLKGNLYANLRDTLANPVSAFPATFLRTTDEPHQLFYDAFDNQLDTTTNWTTLVVSGASLASNTAGVMSMGSGTTANGFSVLQSKPSFKLPIPAWLGVSDAIAIPDLAAPVANSYRYWGTGTIPAIPTTTTPVTDGYGFELGTDGKMRAVVYAGGTRTVVQDLSTSGNSTQPTDASYHRYIIYIRTDKAYWYIDGITSANLVATSNFQSSQVQTLPRLFLAGGAGTPPVSNSQIQCTGATVWDTGKNSIQLSDGSNPWRKATINAPSTPASVLDTAIVMGLSPNSPLPQGNNTLGSVKLIDDGSFASINDTLNQTLAYFPNMIRIVDQQGREKMAPPDEVYTYSVTFTASTAETTIIPPVAGVKTRLIGLVIANSSASTSSLITIRDYTGTSDAQGIQYFQSVGGAPTTGFMSGMQRVTQRTAGQAWTAQCATSTSSIYVTAYYQIT